MNGIVEGELELRNRGQGGNINRDGRGSKQNFVRHDGGEDEFIYPKCGCPIHTGVFA